MADLDCHDVLYVFGALNLVTGRLTTGIVERPWTSTQSKQRYLQEAFAHHLWDIVWTYPTHYAVSSGDGHNRQSLLAPGG